MTRDRTPFGKRLLEARKHAGLSQVDVCKKLRISQGTMSELETAANGSKLIVQLARLYNCSAEWLAEGPPHEPGYGQDPTARYVARELSLVPAKMHVFAWEDLKVIADIPAQFWLVMRDDAMAPIAPVGTAVMFKRADKALPGEGALIQDKQGDFHVREVRQELGGALAGYPTNTAFSVIPFDDEEIAVLGVVSGIQANWAQLRR